jgi:hypothetical protein
LNHLFQSLIFEYNDELRVHHLFVSDYSYELRIILGMMNSVSSA